MRFVVLSYTDISIIFMEYLITHPVHLRHIYIGVGGKSNGCPFSILSLHNKI